MSGAVGRPLRFAVVTVAGFGLDLGLTLALSQLTPVPLPLAAAIGFLTALTCNYLLFEFWAFAAGRARFSARRLTGVAISAGIALGTRLGVIWTIQRLVVGDGLAADAAATLGGAAVSLAVNYLLLKRVFVAR